MFSNPPCEPLPILKALQQVESTQLVTTIFLASRGPCPVGPSLLKTMASSPVSTEQSEIKTFWQPSRSMPSVFLPVTGFLIETPWRNTLSQLTKLSVQPDAPSIRRSSIWTQRQPSN